MSALLVAEDITCAISDQPILRDISLEVRSSESVAVLGPSGSGKTVLLTTLGGLASPVTGRVLISGMPLGENPEQRREVAFVLQSYGLLSLLTAAENIELALVAAGQRSAEARTVAAETLADLDVGSFAEHLTDELSGGQEQRVAVARALAVRHRVILADEPTSEQYADHRELVIRNLFRTLESGAALVVATHDEEVAARCDRIFELRDGTGRFTDRADS